MGWFGKSRNRDGGGNEAQERIDGFRRLGEQVRELHAELAHCERPRALALKEAAVSLHAMAEALAGEFAGDDSSSTQAQRQAEIWFGRLPALIAAARQEASGSAEGASGAELPVRLGALPPEIANAASGDFVRGLKRAVERMEELHALSVEVAQLQGAAFDNVGLLSRSARTRKEAGDALAAAGERAGRDVVVEAAGHYASALADYLLIAQGLVDPSLFARGAVQDGAAADSALSRRPCKLDEDDVWKLTSDEAKRDIRRSGEWEEAFAALQRYWGPGGAGSAIGAEAREYETAVEALLADGSIEVCGYLPQLPFPSAYQAKRGASSVLILGQFIPQDHQFAYDYASAKLAVAVRLPKPGGRRYE